MRIGLLLLCACYVVASCGDDAIDIADGATSTSTTTSTVADPDAAAEQPDGGDDPADEASHPDPRFEVTGTVLERPSEPAILCLGPILTSSPPAGCGDPTVPVDGMDWDALGLASVGGTYSAIATMIGVFEGDRFVLTEPPRRPVFRPPVVNALDMSSECEPPPGGWTVRDEERATREAIDAVRTYAEAREAYAGMWIDWSGGEVLGLEMSDPRGAILNIRFTESLAEHEVAVRELWGGALCVVAGGFSRAELDAIHRTLTDEVGDVVMSVVHDKLNTVLLHVTIPSWVYSQHELDERFGEGAVVVTSAFRPVDQRPAVETGTRCYISSTPRPSAKRPACTRVSSGVSGWNFTARMSR